MIYFIANRATITSALPYVNGVKHLGNIVGSILPADIFHRFLDIMGVDNIYICGTDDHGTAVEIASREEGVSNAEFVKKFYKIQKEIYELWNFDFTFFGGTSSRTNHDITQALFTAAYDNGYVIHRTLTVPYCEDCKRYLPDRYISGTCPKCNYESAKGDQCELCGNVLDPIDLIDPKCTNCSGAHIAFKNEKHLFLDFSLLSDKLEKWINSKDWPYNTKAFALGWIKSGLKPRCITRNLEWGVKVPLEGFENLVFYVWFDAPIGYISITKDAFDNGKIDKWKEYWTDSKIYHFLGKDNIPFHTIFWPGTLMASHRAVIYGKETNFALPEKVIGYEYLNWEGQKFSTSKGVGLFSDEVAELFPIDYWRFYLSYLLPENKDSNFDWDDFEKRINNELIGNYGNLFYRVTHFIQEHFDGKVPKGKIDEEMKKKLEITIEAIEKDVEKVRLREALRHILALANELNKYFQEKEPWKKISTDMYDVSNTLYTSVNLLRSLSVLLYPYIPSTAEAALSALGHTEKKFSELNQAKLRPGEKIEKRLLFKKIEKEELDRAKKYVSKYAKREVKEQKRTEPVSSDTLEKIEMKGDMIPIDEFAKLELKVGTILNVEDHPNADKLYVLQVDMGTEIRQLVAGLKGIYKKEQLLGKQIIIIANLEPKELRGVKSHGMLLAADDGTILSPEKKVVNGSKIR